MEELLKILSKPKRIAIDIAKFHFKLLPMTFRIAEFMDMDKNSSLLFIFIRFGVLFSAVSASLALLDRFDPDSIGVAISQRAISYALLIQFFVWMSMVVINYIANIISASPRQSFVRWTKFQFIEALNFNFILFISIFVLIAARSIGSVRIYVDSSIMFVIKNTWGLAFGILIIGYAPFIVHLINVKRFLNISKRRLIIFAIVVLFLTYPILEISNIAVEYFDEKYMLNRHFRGVMETIDDLVF